MKTFRSLIYLLAFFITFYYPGISIGGIVLNIPIVLLVCIDIYLILKGKLSKVDFIFVGLFFLFALFTSIFRHPLESFILSLTFTGMLFIPFIFKLEHFGLNRNKLLSYLILGSIVSMMFIPFELYGRYMHLFGFSGNELWISISGRSFCYYRASSTMLEPSHYDVVLTFIFIITDIARRRGLQIKNLILFRIGYIFSMLLGVSLSGILLLFIYILYRLIILLYSSLHGTFSVKVNLRKIIYLLVTIFILIIGNYTSGNFAGKVYLKIRERVQLTQVAVKTHNATGSSGVRSSFIWTSKYFLATNNWKEILVGEGYSNYRPWLLHHAKEVGYRAEEVYNLYLILLLSIGLIGLFLFVLMIVTIGHLNIFNMDDFIFIFLIFISFFTHGYLVMYWVWLPILFYRLLSNNTRTLFS